MRNSEHLQAISERLETIHDELCFMDTVDSVELERLSKTTSESINRISESFDTLATKLDEIRDILDKRL